MILQKENLDLFLVPSSLLIMFVYHLVLLYRVLHHPYKTVNGFMNIDKQIWVDRILKAGKDELNVALTVISSSISTATFFASIVLTLSSLIGAWLGGSTSNQIFQSDMIYGDTRPTTIIIKYILLLACFFLSFSFFVQSIRHFLHAIYLLTTPGNDIPVEIVNTNVVRGGDFLSLGLRCLYLALNFILWFFGPIPMFVSSIVMVVVLRYVDSNSVPPPSHHRRFMANTVVKRVEKNLGESSRVRLKSELLV